MTTSISHIVGPAITMNSPTRGRVRRQRCLWCGAVILEDDIDNMAVPIPKDGSPPEPPGTWTPGAVVRISGDNPKVTEDLNLGLEDDLPADACSNLDWEVTR